MPNFHQGRFFMDSRSLTAAMDERHAQILKFHRAKFVQSVEVERLYPMLQPSVLSQADVGEIEQQPGPQAKVQKLLDLLPSRGSQAFQMLCLSLETTYPHLLTIMFLGSESVSYSAVGKGSSQSTVSSYTSESDIDDPRSPRLLVPAVQQNGNRSLEYFSQEPSMRPVVDSDNNDRSSPASSTRTNSDAKMSESNGTLVDARCQHRNHRNYEQLRGECKKAILQLENLKRQHSDVLEKCDQAIKEADYYRNKYRASVDVGDRDQLELQDKRREVAALSADWERCKQEIADLRQTHDDDLKELSELRLQNREVMNTRGSSEVLNKMYDTAWDKYEALKREYEVLKRRNAALTSEHSVSAFNVERMEEDAKRLKGQLDGAYAERDRIHTERSALKQQCTAVLRKYDNARRDVDESMHARQLAEQQCEKAQRELSHTKRTRHDAEKELKQVSEAHTAMVREYTLVMSERDEVHKEIDKLQEEAQTEGSRRKSVEEKYKNILAVNDALKGKMYVMSKERDHALREYNELSDRYRDIISNTALAQKERDKALFEFDKFKDERDVARRERTEALDQRDKLLQQCYDAVQQQKSISYDYDLAYREAEVLRRNLDTAEKELKEVQSETDDAKRQRDRAFQERVKIMMERESIRTLCDKLRRERDRAVSDFAEALRNLDDVKRQKNDMAKQLKEIKDKWQLSRQSENEVNSSSMKRLITHHSRDSAIDADSQVWETETVAIETEREDGDVSILGFDFGDSKDHLIQSPDDCSLIITKVAKGSLADGRLKVNDCVLKVNDIDLTNGDRSVALQAVKKARGIINMVVKRRRSSGTNFCPVTLYLTNKDHGVTLESGIFVSRIEPGSTTSRQSPLMIGDRLILVNGESVVKKQAQEVQEILDTVGELITLNIMRVLSPSTSSGLPSNASPTADSIKSRETLSSKSSLALLSPSSDLGENPLAAAEDDQVGYEERGVQNQHYQSRDYSVDAGPQDWPHQGEQFGVRVRGDSEPVGRSPDVIDAWENGKNIQQQQQQQQQCNHNENTWTPYVSSSTPSQQQQQQQQQQHVHQELPDFIQHSRDDSLTSSTRHSSSHEGSVVDSTHSRQSSRESSGRRSSSRQASDSSRESFRELKHQGGYENHHQLDGSLHGTEGTYRPGKHPQQQEESKENYPPPKPKTVARSDYKTSPAMAIIRRERDSSPRVDPYTERVGGGFYRGADHADQHATGGHKENSTWPKSRGPPEVYLANRKKQKRETTIPVVNPSSYESSSRKSDSEMVPPKPPSRNSSLKASMRHKRSSSSSSTPIETSSTSSSSPQLPPLLQHHEHSTPSQTHGPPPLPPPVVQGREGREYEEDGARPNQNNNRDTQPPSQQSPAVHYTAGSLPNTTAVDFTVVSASSPQLPQVSTQFRPISTPSIAAHFQPPPAAPLSDSSSKGAVRQQHNRCRAQRPNQLQLAPSREHPRAEARSMLSQQIEFRSQPAVTHVVRLPNVVPYFKVHSQALSGGSGRPAYPSSDRFVSTSPDCYDDDDDGRASLPGTPRGYQSDGRRSSNQSFDFDQPPSSSRGSGHRHHSGGGGVSEGYDTFPRREKKEKRIWMTPNYRLSPGPCVSTGSVEKGSMSLSGSAGRDSPVSLSLHSSSGRSSVSSFCEPAVSVTRGLAGSLTRIIEIEKSMEPLGIRIIRGNRGGIFVHTVTPDSLAARAELQYGDQILEFNGLNLRQATYTQAAIILSQGGNNINMKVMYNIQKMQRDSACDSDEATPTSTPGSTCTNSPMPSRPQSEVCSEAGTMTPPTPRASRVYNNNSSTSTPKEGDTLASPCEPRFVFLEKSGSSLGVGVFGGNAVGIFVYEVQPDGVAAKPNGLQVGDQILEFNGVDLRSSTAEQAAMELQKPTEKVSILAQYNIAKFNMIQDQHGDSLYIRAMVNYQAETDDQLSFKKDDILYIDDTMYNGMLGVWSAWLLDPTGIKTQCGQIPSKAVLQKDQARKRSVSQGLQEEELRNASSRRSSGPARRSLFRRKNRLHQRNNSDSKEHSEGSVSDIPIQEEAVLPTYKRVHPLDFHIKRPLILLGPLADRVAAKLVDESPDKFNRCLPKIVRTSSEAMLKELADNVYVDYQRTGSHFECIPAAKVKEITKKGCHCVLDSVSPYVTERLQMLQLFPIVVFIRFKSPKQIKDQKDPHYIPDRVPHRLAKELFEQAQRLEHDCTSLFSDTISGGNLASICTKVKKVVDREQYKTVWLHSSYQL